MTLREQVQSLLQSLCEGAGVTVDDDGDFKVYLGETPVFVRVYDELPAVTFYREVADGVPKSEALADLLNRHNFQTLVFRVLWSDDSVFLRADVLAEPLSAPQFQRVLEDFTPEAEALVEELARWSE